MVAAAVVVVDNVRADCGMPQRALTHLPTDPPLLPACQLRHWRAWREGGAQPRNAWVTGMDADDAAALHDLPFSLSVRAHLAHTGAPCLRALA